MKLSCFKNLEGIYITENAETNSQFQELYIKVRNKEQRIYSDSELAMLPKINSRHLHHKEWLSRTVSSKKLIRYLNRKKQNLKILEISCGNVRLSNKLPLLPDCEIFGLDINLIELKQAARVFKSPNLTFIYGDIENTGFKEAKFDIIVFAASAQYFQSLEKILSIAQHFLNKDGEIHIIDTPFYKSSQLKEVQQRTQEYYAALGYSEMKNYYFHHTFDALHAFNYKILYNPVALINWFFKKTNPFPWICMQHFFLI